MVATVTRPPGLSTPDWVQKLQYTIRPIQYLDTIGSHGHVVRAPLIGDNPNTFLGISPVGIQQLFSGAGGRISSPPNRLLRPIVGDASLFFLEGDRHRRERRLLMPPFHGNLKVVFGVTGAERFALLKSYILRLAGTLRSPLLVSCLFFPALQKPYGP